MTRTEAFLAAAVTAAALVISQTVTNDFYLRVAFNLAVTFIAATGFNVLVGQAGQKSLGHAGLYAVGAYAMALLTATYAWNPWASLLAAALLSALGGVVVAIPALRVRGPSLAMVTIAFGIVIETIVTQWTGVFGGQAGIYGVLPLTWRGAALTTQQWVLVAVLIGLALHVAVSLLLSSRYGRGFAAVRTSEIAAESVGISVHRFKILAFAISAVTCGIAGALTASQNEYINSDFITFNLSVFLLVVVLFGGRSPSGSFLGAACLTVLDAFLGRWPAIQHFTYGALLLFALYAMPEGLSGFIARFMRRRPRPLPPAAEWVAGERAGASTPGAPLLQVEGLHKAFGGVLATAGVSFQLRRGAVVSLIGPNGAGKTTLLNLLSGALVPDAGRVVFKGQDITGYAANRIARAGIGRTFQNLKLFSGLSVLQTVMVGLFPTQRSGFLTCALGLPARWREERRVQQEAAAILRFFQLDRHAQERADKLPYGLQRKLEIARAAATHPDLLLLDEPAAGLNPSEAEQLTELILALRARGFTILLIEHHMDLVMAVSDHVVVMDRGEKLAEGAPIEMQNDARVIAAYLGVPA